MADTVDASPTTPGLLLFGAGAVVGGLAALLFAAAAVVGEGLLPPVFRGPGVETLLVAALLLVAFAGYGYRGYRQSLHAKAAGEPRDAYWVFHPGRVVGSIVGGVVTVVVLALVTKTVVEGATSLTYEIHYFETVPVLSLGAAWFINGEWNRRVDGGTNRDGVDG